MEYKAEAMERDSVMEMRLQGELMPLDPPWVVGIVNLTPDSFYARGRVQSTKDLLTLVQRHLDDGAEMIDLGGCSSRPQATVVSQKEEMTRILPALKTLVAAFPKARFSIDTTRSHVAHACIEEGACLVNDISAGTEDKHMIPLLAQKKIPLWLMHKRGTPQTMTQLTQYEDVVREVYAYLHKQKTLALDAGIPDIWIDVGFGFAKDIEQNYLLLKNLALFKHLDCPIAVGLSRKSMIHKTLNTTPENALTGTSALHMVALEQGAHVLRVHDVKAAKEVIRLHQMLKK